MKFTPGLELLVLSPIPTYPFNYGNRRRIYQQLATFKERGARITFVYYASSWQSEPYLSEHSLRMMASQWDSFFVVHPTVTDHKPQGAYHQLDSWWDPYLEGFLKWIFQKRSCD
ncbi:MAG: hypothetical protein KDD62_02450, partial [Bdellovibrionales bacterium]|nr:hypothetical protein [Bdellovibrionales bacterium]